MGQHGEGDREEGDLGCPTISRRETDKQEAKPLPLLTQEGRGKVEESNPPVELPGSLKQSVKAGQDSFGIPPVIMPFCLLFECSVRSEQGSSPALAQCCGEIKVRIFPDYVTLSVPQCSHL